MSLDALRLVAEYMTPAGRINLARMDASTSKVLSKWEDVHSLLFDDTKIIMAGEVFRHRVDTGMDLGFLHSMNEAFKLCPHSRRIWIQTRLRREQLEVLQQRANTIEVLYISSENFDTQHPLSWENIGLNRLRSVNILHRMDQPLNLRQMLDKTACKALFPFTLRHVCLTGIVLSAAVMDALITLTNLRQLDLIGCVIDTQLAAGYVEKFAQMSNLDELSVPPSMHSFSLKDDKAVPFNMRKLHLSKLSMYMECFDENSFFEALETMMPKKLEALTLYGNFYQLKRSKKYAQWRRFEILFGSMTPQVRTPWWMKDDSILMSHLVRCAPYRIADDFRPIRNTPSSWRFDQSTLENEESRTERQNPTINRFLRFMRPEGAPLAVAPPPPRAPPEAPPPPVRRDRIRRRPNVPTVAEEQHPMPMMISLPPDGAATAPVAVVLPAIVPAPPATPPLLEQQGPAPSSAPAAPSDPSSAPDALAAQPHPQSVERAVVDAPRRPAAVEGGRIGMVEGQQQTIPSGHSAEVPDRLHFVHFQEVPLDTPASANQPQAIVQQPDELPLLNTQPASPENEGVNRSQSAMAGHATAEQPDRQNQRAAAGNAQETAAAHPEHAPNVGDEQAGERQQDDENINMMLQGMLQALVEEIVFDAINEERAENAATDPPPAVSSDATAPNRTNTTNSSTTRTPATPPPTEAQQQQQNRANNQEPHR
ncbi:hypothetical protein Y032_0162g3437 [Ancylostoma ceylanicum]|uniref:Uncharacterized protein n=1 Tax=Ancylostoma ceylanicum TaxID=53326 RepID=A0A016SY05_9BILA|nr:hypothetical protein Y032_0162g3437 [Ancylostoma ceylanicum]